ncbi:MULTISPECIES: DUF4124 domain-containing protein [unclassified Polaromonas]|uniref:DUF4124 domain-containing protein n=1 Tax=unclassified Polaromonas TaxID=2638319 RepID=UPI000F08C3D0|nr:MULTISPECIES: DUF4124 domain-containing protein [unclassified Polaromonas]AYQ30056.1 DUF4124 domain-containing protein [Polaromonas sp. SP1]QGJ18827.1 DUF4124 domain-containing protein [Polaromonas sp. Pch-P]
MRHAFRPVLFTGLLGLLFLQQAAAQVYQCVDAGGKKVFSQLPCASQAGKEEKLIMRAPAAAAPAAPAAPADGTPFKGQQGALYGNSGAAPAPKDWAAENAAANARAAAAEASAGGSRQTVPSGLGGLRKSTPASPVASDKQIIANCEANRGARCNSPGEIAQRRMEQRELSPAERQQQQSAVAARRQREQEEAFNRMIRR